MNKAAQEATKAIVARRRRAYLETFSINTNPADRVVLEDLAKFCRANESTFNPDARIEGLLQGRREVWLRIAQHMNLTDEDAWALYTGVAVRPDVTKSLAPTQPEEEIENG